MVERLEIPKVAKDKLRGYENIYKIKLKDAGYRLVVGKRANDEVYNLLKDRV
nr:hypothetical protein [uncultured Campylobacter sp.]